MTPFGGGPITRSIDGGAAATRGRRDWSSTEFGGTWFGRRLVRRRACRCDRVELAEFRHHMFGAYHRLGGLFARGGRLAVDRGLG